MARQQTSEVLQAHAPERWHRPRRVVELESRERRFGGVMAGRIEISGTRRIGRVVMETTIAAAWI